MPRLTAFLTTPKAKQDRTVRRRNLARAMDLTWSSLRTHLADAVTAEKKRGRGNPRWESLCTREYAEVIYTLSVELNELTKVDFDDVYEALKKRIPQ